MTYSRSVTRDQRSQSFFFANNSVQSCLRQIKCTVFSFLHISKYDYGKSVTVSKIGKGLRRERSDYYEIDCNSLKVQFRTTYNYKNNYNVY